MTLSLEALLAGPRGRALCLALADDQIPSFADPRTFPEPPEGREWNVEEAEAVRAILQLSEALFHADDALDSSPGGVMYAAASPLLSVNGRAPRRGELRAVRKALERDREARRAAPQPLIDAAAEALLRVPLPSITAPALLRALTRSVEEARPWQARGGTDALLARPELRPGLERIAAAVVASGLIDWWDRTADPEDQWSVDTALEAPIPPRDWFVSAAGHEVWSRWELVAWWTSPLTVGLGVNGFARCTGTVAWPRTHASGGTTVRAPLGLLLGEDINDGGPLAEAARLSAPPGARVLEIRGPEDWVALCERHPLDVTADFARQGEESYFDARGGTDQVGPSGPFGRLRARRRDRGGSESSEPQRRWVIPNWPVLAQEYDAAHLSVSGYLTAATRVVEVPGHGLTVVAGWDPDETIWLRPTPAQHPVTTRLWAREPSVDGGWRELAG